MKRKKDILHIKWLIGRVNDSLLFKKKWNVVSFVTKQKRNFDINKEISYYNNVAIYRKGKSR